MCVQRKDSFPCWMYDCTYGRKKRWQKPFLSSATWLGDSTDAIIVVHCEENVKLFVMKFAVRFLFVAHHKPYNMSKEKKMRENCFHLPVLRLEWQCDRQRRKPCRRNYVPSGRNEDLSKRPRKRDRTLGEEENQMIIKIDFPHSPVGSLSMSAVDPRPRTQSTSVPFICTIELFRHLTEWNAFFCWNICN